MQLPTLVQRPVVLLQPSDSPAPEPNMGLGPRAQCDHHQFLCLSVHLGDFPGGGGGAYVRVRT